MRLHCLVSGLKFEAELSSNMVPVGDFTESDRSTLVKNDGPLFRTRLIGLWESDAEMSELDDYESGLGREKED